MIEWHTPVWTFFLLFREIYQQFKASYGGKEDIHTKLMRKYKDIPSWWFHVLLILSILLSLAMCIFMKDQIQMPWWGLIFAAFLALTFTLPISIITATTNQVWTLSFHPYYPVFYWIQTQREVILYRLVSLEDKSLK